MHDLGFNFIFGLIRIMNQAHLQKDNQKGAFFLISVSIK